MALTSKELTRHASGMVREGKENKPKYFDYLPPHVLKRYGEHMLKGAKDHGSANWTKGGYPKDEWIASAMRHLIAIAEGETNEDHAAALMFNAAGIMNEEYLNERSNPTTDTVSGTSGARFIRNKQQGVGKQSGKDNG